MIRIAGVTKESFVDGAGIRYAIFTQGCAHNCPECHNPETHSFTDGEDLNIQEVISDIEENPLLDGITLSGGDPMYQAKECANLIKELKKKFKLNYWCYTGFLYEECIENEDMLELLKEIDVLIDGPFILAQKSLASKFKGSTNQRVIDVKASLNSKNVVIMKEYN